MKPHFHLSPQGNTQDEINRVRGVVDEALQGFGEGAPVVSTRVDMGAAAAAHILHALRADGWIVVYADGLLTLDGTEHVDRMLAQRREELALAPTEEAAARIEAHRKQLQKESS